MLDAATTLSALLTAAPTLELLVTGRTLLRATGEHTHEVGALALPAPRSRLDADELLASPSVALFVERVRAVKPDFELTAENAGTVAAICRELDGVPLALVFTRGDLQWSRSAAPLWVTGIVLSLLGCAAFYWWCERHSNLFEEDAPGSRVRSADTV